MNSNHHLAPFDISLPLKFKGHIPSVEINITGTSLRMGIDTGSAVNLINPKWMTDLEKTLKPVKSVQLQATDQKQRRVNLWRLENINISLLTYPLLIVVFTNINTFNTMLSGEKLDGILGCNFLRQFMTSINLRENEMRIWIGSNALVYQNE